MGSLSTTGAIVPHQLAAAFTRLRAEAPLVQCLTNVVVAGFTANVLLAAGAAPAMIDNPQEAGEFARVAGGVLLNLGTPQDSTVAAMRLAAEAAREAHRPWVLDPVAVGAVRWRTEIAHELLDHGPAIVRGNASEIAALTGGAGGKGVESVATPDEVADSAVSLAQRTEAVIAVSGSTDFLTDGSRAVRIANGHPWLTKVTGSGCALGALMAAFAAVEDDPLLAAGAATALFTVAADRAAAVSAGPGSFAVHLLDQLESIQPDDVAHTAHLENS